MVFWGAPCRQDEHQVLPFHVKMLHFFSVILVFLSETSQRLILLTESTLKSWRARFYPGKIQDEPHPWPVPLFFGWVPPGNPPVHDFDWNKSCVLKVSKLGILTSKLVLLLSDQMQEWSHSRHHFLTVTRGWLLRCHATVSIWQLKGLNMRSSQLLVNKQKTIIKNPVMILRCTHQRVVTSWTHTHINHNFPHTDDLLMRIAYLDCNLN